MISQGDVPTLFEFRGKLCGYLCAECEEPLEGVTVRLYRNRPDQSVTGLAVAAPKDTLALLDDDAVAAKRASLIAETVAAADGSFTFQLGAEQNYEGGPFEIDVCCSTVPHRKPMKTPPPPVQFSITTLQPLWKQTDAGALAYWEYCLPARFWCGIRHKLGAWTICGRVLICDAPQPTPIAGVKVSAFDVDWTQDDPLGSGITDATGYFRIDYLAIDFMRTPFPFLNIELIGGPDLYFTVEGSGGGFLLQEPRARGRDSDRQNVGPCFCVELCVDQPTTLAHAWFTHVGDFDINTDIDPATGLTKWAAPVGMSDAHGGPGFGFYDGLSGYGMKLIGDCPTQYPGGGSPMRYRFLYVNPAISPTPIPITGAAVSAVVVGDRVVPWTDSFGNPIETAQSIVVAPSGGTTATPPPPPPPPLGGPVPPAVIVPDADGWVIVPPTVNGGILSGAPLLRFISATAVPGGASTSPGDVAGTPPAVPRNGATLSIIFQAEPVTGPTAAEPTLTNSLPTIMINNWVEVNLLNLLQFTLPGANCCTPLSTDLGIQYTVDHQLLRSWDVSITSCASGSGWVSPALPSGVGARGSAGTDNVPIGTWPGCSYTVWLTTARNVTDGEQDDTGRSVQVTFCIDR
jgi:hypothetical protein